MKRSTFKFVSIISLTIFALVLTQMVLTKKILAATNDVSVSYQGHVQNIGWQDPVSDGQEAGTDGKGFRVEALKINLVNAPKGASIKYEAHVQNIGWQDPVSDGQEAGTDGESLRVEAIKISLENMPGYSVQYQTHVQNVGWQDWVSDGQEAGTDGRGLRIEALRIKIVKISDNSTVGVQYQGHVQSIGWQNSVSNGQLSGTEGSSLRVEALKINLINAPVGAKIKYQAHVQNVGWQDPVSDGQEIGTDGRGLRIEAIKISLENMPGYSVQYQTHVQNVGWQDWVSDGQEAGTDGKSLRIEALRIRIISTIQPTSVSINKTTDALIVGNSDSLVATVTPSNATNQTVAWSSSNPAVAAVDATGKVTAVSAGTSNITATTVDGAKTSTCAITVVNPSIVSIDDITTNLVQNDTYTLPQTVVANMDNGKTSTVNVSWQPNVADTSKIGTSTFQGLVDGYSKNVKLTLNIQEYVPNLSISSYSSITINGLCKSLSLNLENDGSKPVTINKIEVYENGLLVTTYTSSDLTTAGISTTVESKQNWQSGIDYALGITLNNSYVLYYTESNGSPYQYKSVIN